MVIAIYTVLYSKYIWCNGKWAFSCNLTALICGLVSFVLLILPFVIVLALAAYGGFTALDALEDFMNTEP